MDTILTFLTEVVVAACADLISRAMISIITLKHRGMLTNDALISFAVCEANPSKAPNVVRWRPQGLVECSTYNPGLQMSE